jgi:hypothetical protein
MSLNPGDSSRRARSKSPGRRDNDRDLSRGRYEEEVRERSRTRVEIDQAPSPPKPRYDGDRDARRRYDYEEETVIRSSRSRPEREETKYTSSRKYDSDSDSSISPDEIPVRRTTRASPERRPSRAMPGEFKETVKEEVKVRYNDRAEKEYYEDRKYSRKHIRKQQRRSGMQRQIQETEIFGGTKKQQKLESVKRQSMSLEASVLVMAIHQRRNMLALHHPSTQHLLMLSPRSTSMRIPRRRSLIQLRLVKKATRAIQARRPHMGTLALQIPRL